MDIEVKNLIKIFGKKTDRGIKLLQDNLTKDEILEKTGLVVGVADVSLSIKSSEMFVVMGLSGSGKSTLIRCLNRLHEPTSGSVMLDGDDITKLSMEQVRALRREKMGMVFQRFALYPQRTIMENVGFGLEVQGMERSKRMELSQQAIELVGLSGYEEQYPPQLSGGMQQRVGLARALAMDPEILLMDEPFSALDPLIRKEMQDELIKLQAKMNKTIVFITHDLDEALRLGDKIAIMKDGVIVQIGTPEDILTNPEDEYVTKFTEGVDRTKILKADSVMKEPVETVILGKDGVNVALRKMRQHGLSSILVVDENDRLKGGLLPDDLVKAKNEGLSIKDVIVEDVGRTDPDASIRDLIDIATDTPFPLAVLNEKDVLQGIIVRSYVLEALSRRGEI